MTMERCGCGKRGEVSADINARTYEVSRLAKKNFGSGELAALPKEVLCPDCRKKRRALPQPDDLQVPQEWIPIKDAKKFLVRRDESDIQIYGDQTALKKKIAEIKENW